MNRWSHKWTKYNETIWFFAFYDYSKQRYWKNAYTYERKNNTHLNENENFETIVWTLFVWRNSKTFLFLLFKIEQLIYQYKYNHENVFESKFIWFKIYWFKLLNSISRVLSFYRFIALNSIKNHDMFRKCDQMIAIFAIENSYV